MNVVVACHESYMAYVDASWVPRSFYNLETSPSSFTQTLIPSCFSCLQYAYSKYQLEWPRNRATILWLISLIPNPRTTAVVACSTIYIIKTTSNGSCGTRTGNETNGISQACMVLIHIKSENCGQILWAIL